MHSVKKYEYLDHTADVKFLAYGKTLEEAFTNAALATFAIMTDIEKLKPSIKKEIRVSSKKKESLLYDFLEELIVLVDTEGFLTCSVKKLKILKTPKGYVLNAIISGDHADHYEVHAHIKAVTYHDMFINEEPGKVTVQVVHDL